MQIGTYLFKDGSQNILTAIIAEKTFNFHLWTSYNLLHYKILGNQTALNEQEKRHLLVLPYAGSKGRKILKSMKTFWSRGLPI